MSSKRTTVYTRKDPKELKDHPQNKQIYDTRDETDLIASIKERGTVHEPLRVCGTGCGYPKNTIIAGHRRRHAAVKAGLKAVPVIVENNLLDKDEIDWQVIISNNTRDKTREEIAREYGRLKEIAELRAKQRMEATQYKNAQKNEKTQKPSENTAKEAFPEPEAGQSRDVAAEAVGMSGKTAEKAWEVVGKIDAAEDAGDKETAEALREALNTKSVSAAHRQLADSSNDDGELPLEDQAGNTVPGRLRKAFENGATLRSLHRRAATILGEAEEVAKARGGERLVVSNVRTLVKDLQARFSDAAPWAVCPYCRGKGKDCRHCSEYGWLTEFKWNGIPEERKAGLKGAE